MAELTNMKLDRNEDDDMLVSDSEYPWGLRIHLDDEQLGKLGIDLGSVGDTMNLQAMVKVVSVSSDASESGERRSMALQITDMSFGGGKEKDAADRMYGDS